MSYDGLDIEILTQSKRIGEGSGLITRGVVLNGQEIVSLEGAEFSLGSKLGKSGIIQATFTVIAKSVAFREWGERCERHSPEAELGKRHLEDLRLAEVRKFCEEQIEHERNPAAPLTLTNRAWACQSVLNILDGNIDKQLLEEAKNA